MPKDKIIEIDTHDKNKLKTIVTSVRLLNLIFVTFTDIVDCLRNCLKVYFIYNVICALSEKYMLDIVLII